MTPLEILYISLAVGFLVLVVFICVAIVYLTHILRDVSRVTQRIESLTEKVNDVVLSPIKVLGALFENIGPWVEILRKKMAERADAMASKTRRKKSE